MRNLLLVFFLFLNHVVGFSQQGIRTINTINLSPTTDKQLIKDELPFQDMLPFFSYFVECPEGETGLKIRFSEDNTSWTKWTSMQRETHNMEKYITLLYYGEANYKYYELSIEQLEASASTIMLHFFNPGEGTPPPHNNASSTDKDLLACPCPIPAFEDRNDWCSTSSCPEHPDPSFTPVSHLIVHHSAGSNSSSNWAATVRAIWDFHVNGNGWSDIGYNWLIDPNGVIYQGRGDNIQGAHFCARNSQTMGVCMIGTFTTATPTEAAITSLERLLGWKSCDRDINPLGSSYHPSSSITIPNIAGHRDGCNTECPGDSFYPLLPSVRQGVVDYIENCPTVNTYQLDLATDLLRLSPNPAKGQLSIRFESELDGEMQWQLVNLYQQVVEQWTTSKNTPIFTDEISIEALPVGIYFLHLEINGQKGIWKMIKA